MTPRTTRYCRSPTARSVRRCSTWCHSRSAPSVSRGHNGRGCRPRGTSPQRCTSRRPGRRSPHGGLPRATSRRCARRRSPGRWRAAPREEGSLPWRGTLESRTIGTKSSPPPQEVPGLRAKLAGNRSTAQLIHKRAPRAELRGLDRTSPTGPSTCWMLLAYQSLTVPARLLETPLQSPGHPWCQGMGALDPSGHIHGKRQLHVSSHAPRCCTSKIGVVSLTRVPVN